MYKLMNVFCIISLLITTASIAMEKENKAIFQSIPTFNIDARNAEFINKHHVIIQGKTSCRIFDLKTKTIIRELENSPIEAFLHVCPNKNLFSLYSTNKRKIYDTETMTKKYSHRLEQRDSRSCIFSPTKNSIFMWRLESPISTLLEYNYEKNEILPTNITTDYHPSKILTTIIHPTTHQFCTGKDTKVRLYDYDQNNILQETKTFDLNKAIQRIVCSPSGKAQISGPGEIERVIYSPKGNIIACIHSTLITIINPDNNDISIVYNANTSHSIIKAAAFHPNNSTIATIVLDRPNQTKVLKAMSVSLRYIDVNNNTIIDELRLPDSCIGTQQGDIIVGPNGKTIIIRAKNHRTVLTLDVSNKVIYQPDRFYKALLLQNLLTQHEFSNDIRGFLIKFVLKRLKR